MCVSTFTGLEIYFPNCQYSLCPTTGIQSIGRQLSDFKSKLHYLGGSSTITYVATPSFNDFEAGVEFRFGTMNDDRTHIGKRECWGGQMSFGISHIDRRQHVYVIGKTGTGKTTLLKNLICQDIDRGHGVGVIDPHGDLAEDLLNHIPPCRIKDVLYSNPADAEFPIGFNLVRSTASKEQRHLETSAVVSAFKHFWRESWGPRMEYILYASVAALMECENVSLLALPRMLVDGRYRSWILRQVRDPVVQSFWRDEFAHFNKRFLAETIAPIQNKVGQLLMSAPLRNVFGQVKSKIDLRYVMDTKRIFIANLSKGRLGEDKANLLGSLLVSKFHTAAMERANMPEQLREDFYLYVDEFPNFATDSFAAILSEARKYRLNLILAHQYIEQMRPEVKDAVFGNVGSLISFRVGMQDARVLAGEFNSGYVSEHFTDLPNHKVLVKLLESGQNIEAFMAETESPDRAPYSNREKIIQHSREQFGTRRNLVEGRIRRWLDK